MSNFCMPAEWENHSATILGWPSNEEDWPGKLEAVEYDYCEFIKRHCRDLGHYFLFQTLKGKAI